jgi:hypothetical protein
MGYIQSLMAKRREKPLLKIKVHGAFGRGRIPVPILLDVCSKAQSAVNRQAEALQGRRSLRPGPIVAGVTRECTLELFGLGKGSTALLFARASEQLPLSVADSISLEAVTGVAKSLKAAAQKRTPKTTIDPGVLDALGGLGDAFDKGVTEIEWIVPKHNGSARLAVKFVPASREKLAARIQKPVGGVSSTVEGTLEFAEGKCRISPVVGPPVLCGFEEGNAEEVFEAMRKPVKIRMDAKTRKIESIEITKPEDPLGSSRFFTHKSIEQLNAEQKVQPIHDLSVFGHLSDEEGDELLVEIHEGRRV